jgi:hypothetical protein
MIKLKAYDKYHEQWVHIIIGEDDKIWDHVSSGNHGVTVRDYLTFQSLELDKEACNPERWSDFENFEIV